METSSSNWYHLRVGGTTYPTSPSFATAKRAAHQVADETGRPVIITTTQDDVLTVRPS